MRSLFCLFFFSSRRRHTRCGRDWSSDVCSSDLEVPIIADPYVKMDFGTGALKVTPGHDPNDFEIGRSHGLPELAAIGFDGRMTGLAGEFAGLPAAEAR